MSDESEPKSSRTWVYVLCVVAMMPLMYGLSVGPVAVLAIRGVIPMGPAEVFYRPLGWFIETTGTGAAFEAYMLAWLKVTGTPIPK